MSVKYSCDKCGADMTGDGRVKVNVSANPPHMQANLPKFEGDICPKCFAGVVEGITAALNNAKKA